MAVILFAACARQGQTDQAQPTATKVRITATPAPTPLPPLPTSPPLGSEANPLVMLFVVDDPATVDDLADELSDQYSTASTIVEVRAIDSNAEAYRAFCDGSAQVVALNALGALAASEGGCGEVLYLSELDGSMGEQAQMISAVGRSVFTVEGFRGQVFCRTDARSLLGWIVPALVMRSHRLDPFTELKSVVDKGDDEEVVNGVFTRECSVGATAVGAHEGIPNPNPSLSGRILVIEETPVVPFDAVLLTARGSDDLRALLLDMLSGSEDDLAALMGADALVPAEEDEEDLFGGLADLFEQAGVDPAALAE